MTEIVSQYKPAHKRKFIIVNKPTTIATTNAKPVSKRRLIIVSKPTTTTTTTANAKPVSKRRLIIVNRCGICMTDHKFKKIQCEYCSYQACISCCERYILTQKVAKCMNIYCKREWSSEFISDIFPKTFLEGDYKNHYQNILLDNEKASFPETVECINRLEEIEKALDKYEESYEIIKKRSQDMLSNDKTQREIHSTQNMIYVLDEQIKKDTKKNDTKNTLSLKIKKEIVERVSSLQKYRQILAELYIKCNSLNENIYQYNRDLDYIDRLTQEKEHIEATGKSSKTKYNMKKCPAEECRGFLDINFVCGICKCNACPYCHEVKAEEEQHKCNPDTVKTIDLMTKDTKSCPTCHTNINKIDGCDQMWCTLCHTAFSWTTGMIENKIHNPHYYQWMRSKSENGEIPRVDEEEAFCNENVEYYIRSNNSWNVLQRFRDVYLPKMDSIERNNVKIRFMKKCRFLKNEMTEKNYKLFLEKNAFEKKGHDEFNNFIALTTNVYLDLLHSMIKVEKDTSSKMTIDSEWSSQIVDSMNENVKKLKNKYNILTTKQYLFIKN